MAAVTTSTNTTATSVSAWGMPIQTRGPRQSFADVMSEQLAVKLVQEFDPAPAPAPATAGRTTTSATTTIARPPTQEEIDLELALELSRKLAEEEGYLEPETKTEEEKKVEDPKVDEDHLLALKLQAEFDQNYIRQQRGCFSKVSTVSGISKEELLNMVLDEEEDDSEEEEDFEEENFKKVLNRTQTQPSQANAGSNGQQQGAKVSRRQRRRNRIYQKHDIDTNNLLNAANLERLESGLNVGNLMDQGTRLPNKVYNSLRSDVEKIHSRNIRVKEKADHATTEQVLDPRTRVMLLKCINSGMLREINGVLATGKESRVYHAVGSEGESLAIKVYKTTLNEFRDRDKYLAGEWRFRFQTGKHSNNPRKLIKLWAEKEMKNLKQMHESGLPTPKPILVRGHCLFMEFLGSNGIPAPRLRDVQFTLKKLREIYLTVAKQMRTLYQVCHLVHADLSEFNMLYHQRQVWFIDVAQSVEWDHPNALTFLQKDCTNVTNFFRRCGIDACMTVRELFEFVTDANITEENMDLYLQKMNELAQKRAVEGISAEEEVNEEVFKHSFIPRTLAQVGDPLGELERCQQGDTDIYHRSISGLTSDLMSVSRVPNALHDELDDSTEEDDDSEEEDEEELNE